MEWQTFKINYGVANQLVWRLGLTIEIWSYWLKTLKIKILSCLHKIKICRHDSQYILSTIVDHDRIIHWIGFVRLFIIGRLLLNSKCLLFRYLQYFTNLNLRARNLMNRLRIAFCVVDIRARLPHLHHWAHTKVKRYIDWYIDYSVLFPFRRRVTILFCIMLLVFWN
jgi:hypothetical protein